MTPERWERVKQVFDSAIRLDASQRPAYVLAERDDDEGLRSEVESLIDAHEKDGSFIDSPAYKRLSVPAEITGLQPGQTVGSYRIRSFIGQGGMGEVYLATDTRLNRKVALKLLPATVINDVERMRRFEHEARAASALNHPNIITIYEISDVNSTLMMATEFVEGDTLRRRLMRGGFTLSEVLHVTIQIADALSAAHKAGIVHRDIKPENIMLRPDGYVKVLDFGVAKLVEPKALEAFTEAPTQVKTGTGVVIGTVGYMSPEQARGQTVDARSDIFNLGTVIYEMLSGKAPFAAETPSDVFAAILKSEPEPLSVVAPQTPPELIRIVNKTLRKNRDERYPEAKDLLLDLKNIKEDLDFQAKLGRSTASGDGAHQQGSAATGVIQPPHSTEHQPGPGN